MPTFAYDAKDNAGQAVSGIIEATEPRGAASSLRDQGLWPTRIEAVTGGSNHTTAFVASTANPVGAQTRIDAAPFLVGVPLPDMAIMYRQLGTLLNAGVPIVQAVTTLSQQTRNSRLKGILAECAQVVAGGNPLSRVMERYPAVFSNLEIELIRAAEVSGMMERMCARIADYLEREVEIRRKLKRETLYPKIVLFVALCVIVLLTGLKSGARGAVGVVEWAAAVVAIGFALWWGGRFANQFPAIGATWDSVKMMIPGPGGVARKYATARFTRALGTLYSGGVLLPSAMAIAARACGNRAIGQALLGKIGVLYSGGGLSGVLEQSGLLSPIAVQMARTGEQTGNLDGMMDKVSDYLESEADAKSHQLAVFAGVAALVFAACVVGYIAISFYGGQLSATVNQAGEG